ALLNVRFPTNDPTCADSGARPRPSTLAAVNLAPAVQHGCRSAGLACPLGSSTAAGSSVRHNQGLKARPHALNRFAIARKRFIAHFLPSPRQRSAFPSAFGDVHLLMNVLHRDVLASAGSLAL